MDNVIVFLIGAAALGYLLFVAWQSARGKTACNCGGECSSVKTGRSCCKKK